MNTQVRISLKGRITEVVLDCPQKHNVLDLGGWVALADAFDELSGNRDIGCVMIRGAGDRAFSTGSDISSFADQRDTPEDARRYSEAITRGMKAVRECRHPTLGVIEGLCVGGGMEIAACCDVRICGRSSRFGAPINRLGLTMSHDELEPLIALLGPGPVLEILLTGDLIGAERAREIGLVNRIVADTDVLSTGWDLANRIADGAPLVNRWHKRFILRLMERNRGPLTDAERDEALDAFQTADYREGRSAFLEKRPPEFNGQ
ncbi:MAG TPA: enoyl-CoA hydratase/isomerase family protein [Gemmatimonadetes bacterium]|jgi:enoyl-CoA hydratase/carnithine racemase|nr:enoyl-CoA hydratase/isomerase family protein [Gemmatimonadota bacterium]HIN77648.1 enoyl-CoA hydratase/isomerase family protein [Gemmatimonadota bacterium]